MAASAAHEFDDEYRRTRKDELRKLSGIMLINTRSLCLVPGYSNVEFEPTQCASHPLSATALQALSELSIG